ncbi:MAG: hypothetical protein ACODAA_05415, partial [Gemmatimonadota bacterium]
CTEDALVGVDPDGAPGQGDATIELELAAGDLPAWRDTTFDGYALASTSGLRMVASDAEFSARTLGRFTTVPDSIFLDEENREVERFENARLRLVVDTVASSLPDAGGTIAANALATGFDDRRATWSQADDGVPWATPGGDLAESLGTLALESLEADTVFLPFDVDADSLLTSWRAEDGGTGFALSSQTADLSLTIRQVVLVFDVKPVGRDTLVETLRSVAPATFIFDPETPQPGLPLRIGGLPATRAYLNFRLPESVDGTALRGARINRATLVLAARPVPDAPFAAGDTLQASVFDLLSDPFESGPKTPVGLTQGNSVPIAPEDVEEGSEVQLPLTGLVQRWATAEPDSMPELNVGVRLVPEDGGLPYYEFGSVEDPALAPRLRILLTPETPFDLP